MIALTKEKREELIADCELDIKNLLGIIERFPEEKALHSVLFRQKIALASLTAESFGYVDEDAVKGRERLFSAQVFADEEDLPSYEFSELSYPLYLSPQVPEIKLPEKLSPCDMLSIAGEDAWNNCIDEIKRLNGWE